MVVEDYRVATATSLAGAAEAGPKRGDPKRSQNRGAGCFIKNLISFVHHLNVLSCPYNAVRIGRMAVARDPWIENTVKIEDGRGHRFWNQESQQAMVDDGVRSVHVQGKG